MLQYDLTGSECTLKAVFKRRMELYGGSDQCTQPTHIGLHLVSQQYSKARTEYNGTIHDESGAGVHVASTQTRSSKLKLSLVFTG